MDAIDGTSETQRPSDSPPPSLLVVVLDTNPHAWHALSPRLTFSKALANILVFINAHLAFSNENKVAVIASHCNRTKWLYPTSSVKKRRSENGTNHAHANGDTLLNDHSASASSANKYRTFALVESTVNLSLQELFDKTIPAEIESTHTTQIAGALTLALAYINRIALSHGAGSNNRNNNNVTTVEGTPTRSVLNSRILVVSTSGDLATQYIPLTNAMFAAQHSHVLVDVLKLAGDTVLLQQASFTTGGIFISPPPSQEGNLRSSQPIALIQYLLQALLPDAHARQHLWSPTNPDVDFRAACFCHRHVVNIGYVCSICLSIFCEELVDGLCLTCGSKLILRKQGVEDILDGDGNGKKKDKKKKKKKKDGETGAAT